MINALYGVYDVIENHDNFFFISVIVFNGRGFFWRRNFALDEMPASGSVYQSY